MNRIEAALAKVVESYAHLTHAARRHHHNHMSQDITQAQFDTDLTSLLTALTTFETDVTAFITAVAAGSNLITEDTNVNTAFTALQASAASLAAAKPPAPAAPVAPVVTPTV